MTPFEERLYLERAGLQPEQAHEWWSHYVLSAEAARAIAAGWSADDAARVRAAGLSVDEAIEYAAIAGLAPPAVAQWHLKGVRPSEAAQAVADGWSLQETIERNPKVARRREREATERQEAAMRRAEIDTTARRRADEERRREEAEAALAVKRRSARTILRLDVVAKPTRLEFVVEEFDGNYWATECRKGRHDGSDVCASLADSLGWVASCVADLGGVVESVGCLRIEPDHLVSVSDLIAPVSARQVIVVTESQSHVVPEGVRTYMARQFRDPYTDGLEDHDIYDEDDDEPFWTDLESTTGRDEVVLVMRTVTTDGGVDLVPAIPEVWSGFVGHAESIASVGPLFLVQSPGDGGWEPVGRFDDPAEGREACRTAMERPEA